MVLYRNVGNHDYRIDDAAATLYIPKRSLQRLFARHGTTFRHELIRLRLLTGQRLLEKSSLPIAEIATRCGYRHPMHFSKAFRARYGTSPSAYRASNHQAAEVPELPSQACDASAEDLAPDAGQHLDAALAAA